MSREASSREARRAAGLSALAVGALLAAPSAAHAFEPFAAQIPCRTTAVNSAGTVRPCITCHNNPDGGNGCAETPCLNPFGLAFRANATRWDAALAMLDSDGDGYSNGEELGDPAGTWTLGMASPSTCGCASRPGDASDTPGDADSDGDGYCCRGTDINADGDCLDAAEHDVSLDCDDANPEASSGASELCTNAIDDDCDTLPTLLDPDCASVVDRDGDGFCTTGQDDNGDGDCIDAGEITTATDCDDAEITVFPGSFENCLDALDNNCDALIDRADPMCRSDVDADDDGYCPIGRDLDGDGSCVDEGEEAAGLDCNDSDPAANPDQVEACTDGVDNDCDGRADFRDESCRAYLDADGDGYCPSGRDGNADGDCVDADESGGPGDCDDDEPAVSPGLAERCTNAIDDDCDTRVSLADPDCGGYLDVDGDGYCSVGFDIDGDGDCADPGEPAGAGDCDESTASISPGAEESCTNGIDDDCDGSTDAFDRPTCDAYRDRDGDGYCAIGRDVDGDGDCGGPDEEQEPNDEGHDHEPTVYPGAPESCFDRLDNDLDGEVDEAAACTRDEDADMDGYCPVGRDVNGDGDCLDAGENVAVSDCAPDDPEVSPGAEEACRENVDRDCDGDIGLVDRDCYFLLDRDHDGICGEGIDDNGNGSCLDDGEDRFGADCDDNDARVSPRANEVCDNAIDDDCNDLVDRDDPRCPCESDDACDDGDPCTRDSCSGGSCVSVPSCGDAGTADGGPPVPAPGCGCRVGSSSPIGGALCLLFMLGALAVRRRRALSPRATAAAVALVALAWAPPAYAFGTLRAQVPQGMTFGAGLSGPGCLLCHTSEEGGRGCLADGGTAPCLTSFGLDFNSTTAGHTYRRWDAWLRDRDSDRDGRTNGQELVYFGATFPEAGFLVGDPALATRPGSEGSVHTDECALQSSADWGSLDAPRNYTNCAEGAEVICANGSSAVAAPPGTRYFGFTCGCAAGHAGNGRRDVPGDGIADAAANGCTAVDPCLAAGTCADTDECASPITACGSQVASCTNLLGTYKCECDPGYAAPSTGGSCTNIDECALDNPCSPGTCVDTDGGYTCTSCPTGFAAVDGRCADVPECAASSCGPGLCIESDPGHYTCTRCPTGYAAPALDGPCADVDECGEPDRCDPHAMCTNTPGSFTCACRAGYEGSGAFCSDVDECLESVPDECDVNSICTNSPGSYFCTCREGYHQVGFACVDINECDEGTALCRRDEVCVNRIGMPHECVCAPGFERPSEGAQCEPACGDGARGPGEECDDGNGLSGDGCAGCEVEHGYVCHELGGAPSTCAETCGDALIQLEAGEECDDGEANDDVTPDACRSRCVLAHCGDGVIDGGEECDDGDSNSDEVADACRTDCRAAYCGDGAVDEGEECDPGGATPLEPSSCMGSCQPDAGVTQDAGVEPPPMGGGSCGASSGAVASTPGALILLLVALAFVRRRR